MDDKVDVFVPGMTKLKEERGLRSEENLHGMRTKGLSLTALGTAGKDNEQQRQILADLVEETRERKRRQMEIIRDKFN